MQQRFLQSVNSGILRFNLDILRLHLHILTLHLHILRLKLDLLRLHLHILTHHLHILCVNRLQKAGVSMSHLPLDLVYSPGFFLQPGLAKQASMEKKPGLYTK